MRIAFVTYEFPPDTAFGGIATYVRQCARMLVDRGHDVTVFCATPAPMAKRQVVDGIQVFREPTSCRVDFAAAILPVFSAEHRRTPFDVLEGTDFMADAREIAKRHPDLPLVLKLHTCSTILRQIGGHLSWGAHAKGWIKAGLTLQKPWWHRIEMELIERAHAADADVLAAPSESVGARTRECWQVNVPVELLPNPFECDERFLAVPVETDSRRILFTGRLERRKGVLELARALRVVHRAHPQWRFRFVGRAKPLWVERVLKLAGEAGDAIEWYGVAPHEHMPALLTEADICVFPSRWENFPTVCLEAMAAARGIVGSRFGGMAEMMEHGEHGLIVDPRRPICIADALSYLIEHPERRQAMGRAARERVQARYSSQAIVPRQEDVYRLAIKRRALRAGGHHAAAPVALVKG